VNLLWFGRMTKFSNSARAWFACAIVCGFVLQDTPTASAQAWEFFLECGKYQDKDQADQRVQTLGFLRLPISVRRERDEKGEMWYEIVVKGMNTPDEARRTKLLIETSGGPRCKSELDR
jgi:cell division protein FtsN